MNYKIYKVGDDEMKVKLDQIDQFLKMNPSAIEVNTDTLGKPKGTDQSQTNQYLKMWNGIIDFKTGEFINTESNLETGSLESPKVKSTIGVYRNEEEVDLPKLNKQT